jgi:alkaline phosphatase D
MSFALRFLCSLPAALLASLDAASLRAAELLAGPMVGHTTTTSTHIWVETSEPADVRIDYWLKPRLWYDGPTLPKPVHLGSATGRTTSDTPHTAVVELRDLPPGWMMNYTVRLNGRPLRALTTQSVSLMPPDSPAAGVRGGPPDFAVAFGSCNHPPRAPIQPIWTQILRRRPAAFIFLGDNNYLPKDPEMYDIPSADLRIVVADTHRNMRNIAGLRDLMSSTPSYGIWDDHDFGPNNSDRTFPHRRTTLELFHRYWPNPAHGVDGVPGVFHSFRIVDVEFFMLDNRYHRDPKSPSGSGTMVGRDQLDWLKQGLKASTAVFKVIGQGGTSLVDSAGEAWADYRSERDDFLAWVFRENITGVFFIAGDWHVGVLNRLHRATEAYPLYELLSSNLAVSVLRSSAPRTDRRTGPGTNQWVSPHVQDTNFGLLSFSGPAGGRTAALQLIDETGAVRTELRLAETDLRSARPDRR